MDHFQSSVIALGAIDSDVPLAVNRPWAVRAAGEVFVKGFEGDILYAVKANPSPWVLEALWAAGVRSFDVASLPECALVRKILPEARLAFMHPVKSRRAIAAAYYDYGVRVFALDCEAELTKILEETNHAEDLTLVIRMAVSNQHAGLPLTAKFGASGQEAVEVLKAARAFAAHLGVSFHVGSQCMEKSAWTAAMTQIGHTIRAAGVVVDVVDVGGGFPSHYPGMEPVPMAGFFAAIHDAFEAMPVTNNCQLWAEPGRALVAEATSIITRVDLRKGSALYLNDGAYGTLFDATHVGWRFPMRVLRKENGQVVAVTGKEGDFSFYGPTCDSIDAAKGPFGLPDDVAEGDFVEFGMLGAYGVAMATNFNGYGIVDQVTADDMPFAGAYNHLAPILATEDARQNPAQRSARG